MINKLWLCLCLTITPGLIHTSEEEPLRFWKDSKGREIIGELVASDGVRATLRVEDNSKKVFPLSFFSGADQQFITSWRSEHPEAPWIDSEAMPAWPQMIGKGVSEVKQMPSDDSRTPHVWRSRHFDMRSDMKLPLSVVRDMATIFEATRLAVHFLPLGLAASPPVSSGQIRLEQTYPELKYNPDLLRVQLYGDNKLFAQAGAPAGSGGFYQTMLNRTVLSLDNLGIKGKKGAFRGDYMKNAFVLKHEITHHLLHDWTPYLPIWFTEGFAEYMGAASYSEGQYKFVSMDRHLHKYLNRWRFNEDPNRIPIMKLEDLMTITHSDWVSQLKRSTPIIEYNSAAVIVHFFIHHDGKGDAAHLAAYLDAIRQGIHPSKAEKTHLLRDRTYEQLGRELVIVWKNNKVALEPFGDVDPFK